MRRPEIPISGRLRLHASAEDAAHVVDRRASQTFRVWQGAPSTLYLLIACRGEAGEVEAQANPDRPGITVRITRITGLRITGLRTGITVRDYGDSALTVTVHSIRFGTLRLRPALQRRQAAAAARLQVSDEVRAADRPADRLALAQPRRRFAILGPLDRSAKPREAQARRADVGQPVVAQPQTARQRSTIANLRRARRAAPAPG